MNLIFDFDGTLHKSDATYVPAFNLAQRYLVERGLAPQRTFSDEEIGYWLGFADRDMWDEFAPDLPDAEKKHCSRMIGDEMRRLALAGHAQMYPGAAEALDALVERGHTLVFLSNCHRRYMEIHRDVFGLERWFRAFYCSEDYGWVPKAEVFDVIRERFGTPGVDAKSEFIVIGDRFHDLELKRRHGLAAIGCAYGYGAAEELEDADIVIDSASAIPDAVERLLQRKSEAPAAVRPR